MEGDCLRFDVSGRKQTSSHFKVKIKIQNDVIVHQCASLSVNEDVRIDFNQSNQCFNALKCRKCAIKIKKRGCVTVRVRSRAIDRENPKIEKNVKLTEFEHNGACSSFLNLFWKVVLASFERLLVKRFFDKEGQCPKIVKKIDEFDENYGAPPPPCLERAATEFLQSIIFGVLHVRRSTFFGDRVYSY